MLYEVITDDNHVGAYGVQVADQPAIGDLVGDLLDTGEGLVGIRHVVDQQQDAGEVV